MKPATPYPQHHHQISVQYNVLTLTAVERPAVGLADDALAPGGPALGSGVGQNSAARPPKRILQPAQASSPAEAAPTSQPSACPTYGRPASTVMAAPAWRAPGSPSWLAKAAG